MEVGQKAASILYIKRSISTTHVTCVFEQGYLSTSRSFQRQPRALSCPTTTIKLVHCALEIQLGAATCQLPWHQKGLKLAVQKEKKSPPQDDSHLVGSYAAKTATKLVWVTTTKMINREVIHGGFPSEPPAKKPLAHPATTPADSAKKTDTCSTLDLLWLFIELDEMDVTGILKNPISVIRNQLTTALEQAVKVI